MLGNEEGHFVVELRPSASAFFFRMATRISSSAVRSAPVRPQSKRVTRTVVQAVDVLRIGVAGDDDLFACLDQRVEQEENSSCERFLPLKNCTSSSSSTSSERYIAFEGVEGFLLVGTNDVGVIILGMNIADDLFRGFARMVLPMAWIRWVLPGRRRRR